MAHWFKVVSVLATSEKWDALTDGAARAIVNIWCYTAQHSPSEGRVPTNIHRLVPGVTPKRVEELEAGGWLDRNGTGWIVHDWHEHQSDVVAFERRRAKDRERKAAKRREASGEQ